MTYRTLRAGVFLPPFHPNDEDPLLCMERDFQLMQWLDAHDYAEAWIGEHHSGGYEIYGQPELFIATAAERTRQIRLGTGVISLPYHHPFMVADRIVQLDYQTRGRAMFGFGPGLLPSDAMMLGIDPETQRDRMADAIDIITRLLDGETITQQSEWYTMREARLHLRPYSKPRPHLAIASAVTPYGGKLAGRYDLGMLCVMAGSPNGYDTLDYNWELANAEAAAQGRVMDRANYRVMAPFHIAETREKAIENVRAGFEKWQLYSYSVNPEGGAAIGMPSIEEINAGGRGAIGTPDDALRVLGELLGQDRRLRLHPDARPRLGRLGGDQALLRIVRALRAAALRGAQCLALAIDGLDARQSRSLQRQTQGRRRERRRTSLRRRAGEEPGSREVA